MIIKSKSIKDRKGIARTVRYLFGEEKEHTLLHTRFLPCGADIETIIKRMEENESRRLRIRKDSVILFHDYISFHKNDAHKLSDDEVLRKIARKYSLMRDQSITVCVLHREREHIHIHVLASGCRLDGRSSRISKAEFGKKKHELERFQQRELRLVHSRVNHEKKRSNQPSRSHTRPKKSSEAEESLKNKSSPNE